MIKATLTKAKDTAEPNRIVLAEEGGSARTRRCVFPHGDMRLVPNQLREHLQYRGPWVLGAIYAALLTVVVIALCVYLVSAQRNAIGRWIVGALLFVTAVSLVLYALQREKRWLRLASFVFGSLLISPLVSYVLARGLERQLPRIIVLGPTTPGAENEDVWNDVIQGIRQGAAVWNNIAEDSPVVAGSTIDVRMRNDRFVRIEFLDDGGTVGGATKALQGIRHNPNVVLVIGHCQSSVAIGVRSIYVSEMLPLITPAVTAEEFSAGNDARGIYHLYRVCPTDSGQASIAAGFIRSYAKEVPGALRLAVFRDGSNAEYSNPLANALRAQIASSNSEVGYRPKVIYDGTVAGSGGGVMITDSVVMFEPQLLVCVGMSDVAVPLIWQTRQMQPWWQRLHEGHPLAPPAANGSQPQVTRNTTEECAPPWEPAILLTDGAVTLAFQRAAHEDMGTIYATFPEKVENNDGASYAPFGYDAVMVALTVIREVSDVTRRGVAEKLESSRDSVIYKEGRTGEIRFGVDGNRRDLGFHILELKGKQFTHSVTRCPCKGAGPRDEPS